MRKCVAMIDSGFGWTERCPNHGRHLELWVFGDLQVLVVLCSAHHELSMIDGPTATVTTTSEGESP